MNDVKRFDVQVVIKSIAGDDEIILTSSNPDTVKVSFREYPISFKIQDIRDALSVIEYAYERLENPRSENI